MKIQGIRVISKTEVMQILTKEGRETHCNPGYDYMLGLRCTSQELAEATERYIHSLRKKTKYE